MAVKLVSSTKIYLDARKLLDINKDKSETVKHLTEFQATKQG